MNKCTEQSDRLHNCNFVKTILMVLVVVYHCALFWEGNWYTKDPIFKSSALPVISEWLNSFHIYGFTLVSGYIFYYLRIEKQRYNNYFLFLKNKILRLIVPYIFVSIIWVIPILIFYCNEEPRTVIMRFVLGMFPEQLWFLIMLFNVFAISYLLSKIWNKNFFIGLITVGICYIIGCTGGKLFDNYYMIWFSMRYILYFWIGFVLCKYKDNILWKIPPFVYVLLDGILFLYTCKPYEHIFILIKVMNFFSYILLNVVGALMAFFVLQGIASVIRWDTKFFKFLSDKSMTVYLFHQQLIYFTITWLNGVLIPELHFVVNFVFSFVLSLILSIVLEKFRITSFLIGKK